MGVLKASRGLISASLHALARRNQREDFTSSSRGVRHLVLVRPGARLLDVRSSTSSRGGRHLLVGFTRRVLDKNSRVNFTCDL